MSKRLAINPDAKLVQPFVYTQQQLPTHRPIVQYIRQSTAKQLKKNKQSYELQDSDLRRRLVEGYGWKESDIIKIDSDQGKSGTKRRDERTGLDELYTLLETGKAGAVAAFDVSRLYRVTSKAETGTFCDMVMELHAPIVTFSRIYWPNKSDNDQLEADLRAAGAFIDEIIKGKLIAAKNRHIEYDHSYGGHSVPFGYIVPNMYDEQADRKYYTEYKPHADLIRYLFRLFKDLSGNLALFARELVETDFRFPPFEPGVPHHVSLPPDVDGSYPLRNRHAIIGLLTNKSYIGRYEYGGVLVSPTAWDPIVPLSDFIFAYWTLTGTDLDGEPQERKPRERRYGGASALLDGVLHSCDTAVYVIDSRYAVRPEVNGFPYTELAIPVTALDEAFSRAMIAMLGALELGKRRGLHEKLNARIQALQQEQEKQATDFAQVLARIDSEIATEETAQSISKRAGDWNGYEVATKQLVVLRKDRLAIEARSKQASSEASELAECHGLIECACQQWSNMPIAKRKRLIRLLGVDANLIGLSPHFIQLDVQFGILVNKHLTLYLHRARGSRLYWTDEEDSTLAALFPTADKQVIMAALPRYSWASICWRGYERLGIRRGYTKKDILAYADLQVIEQCGARVDKPVWRVDSDKPNNMTAQLWGAVPGCRPLWPCLRSVQAL